MRRLIRIELLLAAAVLATLATARVAQAAPSAGTAGATEYVPFVSDFPRPAERYVPFVTDFPAAPAPAPAADPVATGIDWSAPPVEGVAFALALLTGAAFLVLRRRAGPRPLDC